MEVESRQGVMVKVTGERVMETIVGWMRICKYSAVNR